MPSPRVLLKSARLKRFRSARPYETAVLFQNLVSVGFPLGLRPRPSKRCAFFGGYPAPIEANLAFSTALAATPSRRTPRPRSAVRLLPRPSSAIRVAWHRRAMSWLAPCRRASLPCSRLAALDASRSRPTCSASSSVASRCVSLVPHCALPCVVLPGPNPASRQ